MGRLIKQSEHIARKVYRCEAFINLINMSGDFTAEWTDLERKAFEDAKKNKGQIQKGQKYIRQFGEDEGEAWEIMLIPELHAICVKYDYYEYE